MRSVPSVAGPLRVPPCIRGAFLRIQFDSVKPAAKRSFMAVTSRMGTKSNGRRPAGSAELATTRTHRIRASIEHAIVSGRLAPGSKLDENVLAARYGASRTPVREALQ